MLSESRAIYWSERLQATGLFSWVNVWDPETTGDDSYILEATAPGAIEDTRFPGTDRILFRTESKCQAWYTQFLCGRSH